MKVRMRCNTLQSVSSKYAGYSGKEYVFHSDQVTEVEDLKDAYYFLKTGSFSIDGPAGEVIKIGQAIKEYVEGKVAESKEAKASAANDAVKESIGDKKPKK